MPDYLMIENKGEVELNAFMLMGASTKRGAGKIGLFGTGTKYALATLLKARIRPVVFSGSLRIDFATKPASLGGQEYDQIVLSHGEERHPLGFTTEMGLNWKVPDALRELISNALDEEEGDAKPAQVLEPRPGRTRIFVPWGEEVALFHANFDRYFLKNRKPIAMHENYRGACAVYDPLGSGTRVYRRGVLVFEDDDLRSCFDYDIPWLVPHEDRTCGLWEVQYELAGLLDMLELKNKIRVLRLMVSSKDRCLEANLNNSVCSPGWRQAIDALGEKVVSISAADADPTIDRTRSVVLPEAWVENLTNATIACRGAKDPITRQESSIDELSARAAAELRYYTKEDIASLRDSEYRLFCAGLRAELAR